MKGVIKHEEKKEDEITYPCLMENTEGTVMLFHENSVGTVVLNGSNGWGLGRFGAFWPMESFTPFTGTIELSND